MARYSEPVPLSPCAATTGSNAPLVALLGRAEAAFEAEFDRRLKETPFCSLSLAHARNVLQHLADGPLRASQLVTACEVTKQALSQQISHLERGGYLIASPDPADSRARLLSLTPQGARAHDVVRSVFAEIETSWADQLGAQQVAELRQTLARIPGECSRSTGSGPGAVLDGAVLDAG